MVFFIDSFICREVYIVTGKLEAFIFDLDGTIYIGDEPITGGDKVLKQLRNEGTKIRFVTNNPRFSREFYAEKLNGMDIEAKVDEIVTSGWLTAKYLKNNPSYGTVFMIGEKQLQIELLAAGIQMAEVETADTVLVSFDTTLSYQKIQRAFLSIKNGANFIATNPDSVCPTPNGGLVDAGAIIAALETSTGRQVQKVIGKPSQLLGQLLLEELDVSPEKCVVVGDRLNTDVKLGKEAGMKSVWIKALNEEMPADFEYRPDFIIQSIAELPSVLKSKNFKI